MNQQAPVTVKALFVELGLSDIVARTTSTARSRPRRLPTETDLQRTVRVDNKTPGTEPQWSLSVITRDGAPRSERGRLTLSRYELQTRG